MPNWSRTNSGAVILNDGHVDIASVHRDGVFTTTVKDTTVEGLAKKPAGEQAYWHDPDDVVLQLLPESRTSVPNDPRYACQTGPPAALSGRSRRPSRPDCCGRAGRPSTSSRPPTPMGFGGRLPGRSLHRHPCRGTRLERLRPGQRLHLRQRFGQRRVPRLGAERLEQAPAQEVTPGPTVPGSLSGGTGLTTGCVLGSAPAGAGRGTAQLDAGLRLELPTDTAPGTYAATPTLTAI